MEMKTTPFKHQFDVWQETKDFKSFAIFWEQGTGKTKLAIDSISYQYLAGSIDGAIIVAPNGVHLNWLTDELPTHLPNEVALNSKAFCWDGAKKHTKDHRYELQKLIEHKGMTWLFISYDAFITEAAKDFVWAFLKKKKVYFVLDESSAIKNPSAKRTKSLIAASKYAKFKRIMEGTPITVTPFDVYSQIKFVDENFWKEQDIATYSAFKAEFGIFQRRHLSGGGSFDQLVGYKNIDVLANLLKPIMSRVLKEDVLDLPDKLYTKRYFTLSPEQRRVYDQVKEEQISILESGISFSSSIIVTQLRLQQITSGYLPVVPELDEAGNELEPIMHDFAKNPRLDLLAELTENPPHPMIIWAKYSRDIDKITDMLGKTAVRYDGKIDDEECAKNKLRFQNGDATFFVSNPAKGATGLTLNTAKTSIFYNNSYNLRHRLQSEDRNHRIGQNDAVLYIDLEARGTIDKFIIDNLLKKQEIASSITGDRLKEWLRNEKE